MSSPKKRVHWDDDAAVADTPSPTLSVTSPTSSVELPTPQASPARGTHVHIYQQSPPRGQPLVVPSIVLPPLAGLGHLSPIFPLNMPSPPRHLEVSPILSSSRHASSLPPFKWDITCPPPALPEDSVLLQPATIPPVAELIVRCNLLPWELFITPTLKGPGLAYVTIQDVLAELYTMLQHRISRTEYQTVCAGGPQVEQQINTSFHERCKQVGERAALEERERQAGKMLDSALIELAKKTKEGAFKVEREFGLRRVDLLIGQTVFGGLRVVQAEKPNVVLLESTIPVYEDQE